MQYLRFFAPRELPTTKSLIAVAVAARGDGNFPVTGLGGLALFFPKTKNLMGFHFRDRATKRTKGNVQLPRAPRGSWIRRGCLLLGVALLFSGCGSPVNELVAQLEDANSDVRYEAAKALEQYGSEAAPAVPALAKMLSEDNAKNRYRAVKLLDKIGNKSKQAATELIGVLQDSDEQVRYYAVKTVEKIAEDAPDVFQSATNNLTNLLKDANPKVRYYAAKALGKIGVEAESALPALEQLNDDQDESVRKAVESAIRRINRSKS
jgi:HEAT repeat protein